MRAEEKTRRAGQRKRASEVVLAGIDKEDTPSPSKLQQSWIAARYRLGEAHARAIAEHAFASRAAR